ncbi:MAG TPA: N-acetylmuramoyl-L-alanine amidase [Tissierellaceae bacterium]|nr:N-acetylmuramoyl-L-alanine amidase [Tissierellaceae bacterium]
MIIGIDCGHTLKGADTGAEGQGFKEQDKTREVGSALIGKLSGLGHKVINCTVDSASTVSESLSDRVNIANKNNLDLYMSIHLNAFNKEARGFEVHIAPTHSSKSLEYANSIKTEICKLGYVDRGVKVSNLYVLNNTKAPAVLLECGFIDNREDMALYNVEKITNAILEGLNLKPLTEDNRSNETVVVNGKIAELQGLCNSLLGSNLVIDNIWGSNTEAAVRKLPLCGVPYLQRELTTWVQLRLSLKVDGIYGNNTKKAVEHWQSYNDLVIDGVVGFNTYKSLAKY